MFNITSASLQNALRRTTSTHTTWLREVDGLRFVAIFAVMLQHLLERFAKHTTLMLSQPVMDNPFGFFISRGTVGVFLFFAISGFVLALPFAKYHLEGANKPSLRSYFIRRVTRLEPPYIIWMCVFTLVLLITGAYSIASVFPHLLASLTYTHGLFFGDHSPINPVAWSLEVEIQFYILAPFLAAMFFGIKNKNTRRIALIAGIFGWILLQSYFGWLLFPFKLSILGQLPHFLIGFLVADFYLVDWKNTPKENMLWDIAAIVAYVTMCYTWTTELWKNMVFAVALFTLFTAAFRGVFFKRLLQNGWIAVGGGMCYTIYLIHLPMLEGMTIFTKNIVFTDLLWVNFLIQVIICLPIVWVIGSCCFLLLEKPFMRVQLTTWSSIKSLLIVPIQFTMLRTLKNKLSMFVVMFICLIPAVGITQSTLNSNDTLQLRPLAELIASAQKNAPAIDMNRTDVAQQTLTIDVQRKSWTDLITMSTTGYFGNGIIKEERTTSSTNVEYATGRVGTSFNVSLGVRISGGDIATRRQKTKIQELRLDRLEAEREMIVNDIRDEVSMQYFQLKNILEMVHLRAQAVETIRMARVVAEKFFKEGNLPIGEYTNLLMQETSAQEEFIKAQYEAKQRAVALENLTGIKIWAN